MPICTSPSSTTATTTPTTVHLERVSKKLLEPGALLMGLCRSFLLQVVVVLVSVLTV